MPGGVGSVRSAGEGLCVGQGILSRAALLLTHQLLDEATLADERTYAGRVKVATGLVYQFLESRLRRHRPPIGPIRSHGIEGIRHRHNPCGLGDLLAGQTIRIAVTVPALMVIGTMGIIGADC